MKTYLDRYRLLGLTGGSMTESQIGDLAAAIDHPLPDAYRAYLSIAGSSPPPNLVGSDCHGHYLPQLHEWAVELLAECNHPFILPDNAVVFLMHQGYQFFYFVADGNSSDPAIHYYFQGKPAPELAYDTFTDWVRAVALSLPVGTDVDP